jgi:sphinganine-1-phosphate aldolase
VIVAAFERYAVSNPLHPDVFPTIRKMEAEIVSMCLRMYNNPNGAGTMTSGGTESIVMAVKTYRDWAREVKGITEPEMWVLKLLCCESRADTHIVGSFRQQPTLRSTKARRT